MSEPFAEAEAQQFLAQLADSVYDPSLNPQDAVFVPDSADEAPPPLTPGATTEPEVSQVAVSELDVQA
jgi:hypothetical protein